MLNKICIERNNSELRRKNEGRESRGKGRREGEVIHMKLTI